MKYLKFHNYLPFFVSLNANRIQFLHRNSDSNPGLCGHQGLLINATLVNLAKPTLPEKRTRFEIAGSSFQFSIGELLKPWYSCICLCLYRKDLPIGVHV